MLALRRLPCYCVKQFFRNEGFIVFNAIVHWLKQEKVLCIAAVCTLITMFFVPPDGIYFSYIDLRVLCLLLCLMAVVAGFQHCGAFQWLAVRLLQSSRSGTILGVVLVLLPFFSAMLVTNDVALLTFVPFTLLLLEQIGCVQCAIPVLVLQTIAANLGSMATPVGNPQNLFLYAFYELAPGEFFSVTMPLTLVSLLCLLVSALPLLPRQLPALQLHGELGSRRALAIYGVLFLFCLLSVFRILPYGILTVIVLLTIAVLDKSLLKELDYGLLATFVCFFIISGNLGRLDVVRTALQQLLEHSPLLTAVAASQVISNVPAAVLLSGFTGDWASLLEGVNIGGLGTPVASLASLITLKQYLAWPNAKPGRYLAVFTGANLIGLLLLLLAAALI